jgi:hypothetical protein
MRARVTRRQPQRKDHRTTATLAMMSLIFDNDFGYRSL